MHQITKFVPAVAVSLLLAACGSSSSTKSSTSSAATKPASGGSVEISSRNLPGLGAVLVDAQGRTLYTFVPDNASKVTCTGGCASVWPPLTLPSAGHPVAAGAVTASLLSSDPDPSGGRVITFKGWPLYNYVGDPTPGSVTGEGINSSGGLWYVISPTGTVIKQKS
jgi:predicted lipoprotein with Yx(FWY)xxD motif